MKKRVVDGIFAVSFLVLGFVFLATSANGVTGAVIGVPNLLSSFLNLALAGIFLALSMVAATGGTDKKDLEELVTHFNPLRRSGIDLLSDYGGVLSVSEIRRNKLNEGQDVDNLNKSLSFMIYGKANKLSREGATDAHIDHRINSYLKHIRKEADMEQTVEENKDKLTDEYIAYLSKVVKAGWDEELKRIKKEESELTADQLKKYKVEYEESQYTRSFVNDLIKLADDEIEKTDKNIVILEHISRIKKMEELSKKADRRSMNELKKYVGQGRGMVSGMVRDLVDTSDDLLDDTNETMYLQKKLLATYFVKDGQIDDKKLKDFLGKDVNAYARIANNLSYFKKKQEKK